MSHLKRWNAAVQQCDWERVARNDWK